MRGKLLKILSVAGVVSITIFVVSIKKTNLRNNVKVPLKKVEEESPYRKYGYNIEAGLSKYRNALKNVNSQKVRIYCIGESNTRGEYSSDEVNKSWVGIMKSSLQDKYGNAGEGFINIYEGALPMGTKPRWRLGDGWSVSGASNTVLSSLGGFGGCYGTSNNNISSATLIFNGTNLDLLYSKTKDGGEATITIDGREFGNISCLGKELSFSHKASYSGLESGTHTLVITPNTKSSVFIEGAVSSLDTKGMEVDKIAVSSKRASYFNTISGKRSWDGLPEPNLVLLSFGLNEAGNKIPVEEYKSNMIDLVTYWKDRGSDVCIVTNQKPADSWTTNWSPYITSLYEIADSYNTALIDINKAFFEDYTLAQKEGLFGMAPNDYSGGSGTNTAHPSDKGYRYVGEVIYGNLK